MDGQCCDRCPAYARVRVTFGNGLHLYMCRHHEREFFPEHGTHEGVLFEYQTVNI